jgi:hypothetical protein
MACQSPSAHLKTHHHQSLCLLSFVFCLSFLVFHFHFSPQSSSFLFPILHHFPSSCPLAAAPLTRCCSPNSLLLPTHCFPIPTCCSCHSNAHTNISTQSHLCSLFLSCLTVHEAGDKKGRKYVCRQSVGRRTSEEAYACSNGEVDKGTQDKTVPTLFRLRSECTVIK